MTLNFLNLLRLVLWSGKWFILVNVLCALGKNITWERFDLPGLVFMIYNTTPQQ